MMGNQNLEFVCQNLLRELRKHTSNRCSNALIDLTLIKLWLAPWVNEISCLYILTSIRNKHIAD